MKPMIKLSNFASVTSATKTWAHQRNLRPYTYYPCSTICVYTKMSLGAIQQKKSDFVCSTCVERGSRNIYHSAECSTRDLQSNGSQWSWQAWLCTVLGHQKCSIYKGWREHSLAHLCSPFQTLDHVAHSAMCSTSLRFQIIGGDNLLQALVFIHSCHLISCFKPYCKLHW